MLATCINHAFIKAVGGFGPLCPAATGIRMGLVAGDWRGTKWVRPEEGLCWRNEADSVEKNQDQREPWAPGGAESNCSCLLWLCHHRASVITMGCNATALGVLGGDGCRYPACPLLQSSSCLSPVPFVVCLSPWFPTPSFCPLLTSLLCCQQHSQLFLLTRHTLQRCVGSGKESEKEKKKKKSL